MARRTESDEHYVLDLCDEMLGQTASRQHRFDWLRGDPSAKTGRAAMLPVDGYWESFGLVVEFHEMQHTESVAFFDKPDRMTVSGVHRGEQRAKYDARRRELIPAHGLTLVIIDVTEFEYRGTKRKRIVRNHERDRALVERRVETFTRR